MAPLFVIVTDQFAIAQFVRRKLRVLLKDVRLCGDLLRPQRPVRRAQAPPAWPLVGWHQIVTGPFDRRDSRQCHVV